MQAAKDNITLWQNALSRAKGIPISIRIISRLERRTNTKNTLKLSILAMKERLKESYQRYYLLKKDVVSLRES